MLPDKLSDVIHWAVSALAITAWAFQHRVFQHAWGAQGKALKCL